MLDKEQWEIFDLTIGRVYWRTSVPGRRPNNANTSEPAEWARKQKGNWAAVIEQGSDLFLLTDGPRSYPLLYARQNNKWLVSSSAEKMMAALDSPRIDKQSAAEFAHTCFVLGNDTLISGVKSVPPASVLRLGTNGTTQIYEHLSLMPTERLGLDHKDFFSLFHEKLLQSFAQLVEDANGRQLLVPLSGGADSRLILTILHELGASNVCAFSYGFPESKQAKISQEVAKGLGYPWLYISYGADDVYRRWWRTSNNSFIQHCWTGLALPHIQDWYALGDLRERKDVADDAIILPGHTVVGCEHDDWCFDPELNLGKKDMLKVLAKHHLSQQGNFRRALQNVTTREKLLIFLEKYWGSEDPSTRSDVLVAFNLAERQAKYINNSMRGYEHFGFSWALPMLERAPWKVWINGDQSVHDSARTAYLDYVNKAYSNQAGVSIGYWGVVNRLSPSMACALQALTKLGLRGVIDRLFTAHVYMKHPMGFEGFAGGIPRWKLACNLYSGASILGVFANLFLEEQWVPHQHVLPPEV